MPGDAPRSTYWRVHSQLRAPTYVWAQGYWARVTAVAPWPMPYWPLRPPLTRSCSASTAVIRPDSASMSSTVLTAEARLASDRTTASAAVPVAAPSRPASTVPEPCGAIAAANRATVAPWLPASSPSAPPVTMSAALAAPSLSLS